MQRAIHVVSNRLGNVHGIIPAIGIVAFEHHAARRTCNDPRKRFVERLVNLLLPTGLRGNEARILLLIENLRLLV